MNKKTSTKIEIFNIVKDYLRKSPWTTQGYYCLVVPENNYFACKVRFYVTINSKLIEELTELMKQYKLDWLIRHCWEEDNTIEICIWKDNR